MSGATDLIEVLREAHNTIVVLAGQQAMVDEWYRGTLERVDAALTGLEREHALMSAAEAEAAGYTVDRHCYPWIAYKGPRFQPDEWFVVQTPAVDSD